MRLFFALEPDHDTRHRLERVVERLQAWELEGRWVHPADYHVTQFYLGEVPDHEAGWLEHAVNEYCDGLSRPTLSLPGLAGFAGRAQPRVVYAAIEDRAGWCAGVHRDLAELVSEDPEPHYTPHITILRPNQNWTDGRWPAIFEAFGHAVWGDCVVDAIGLYESRQPAHKGGPRYRCLQRWALND